ncbi:hypothetical protein [Escherichia phage FL38]
MPCSYYENWWNCLLCFNKSSIKINHISQPPDLG